MCFRSGSIFSIPRAAGNVDGRQCGHVEWLFSLSALIETALGFYVREFVLLFLLLKTIKPQNAVLYSGVGDCAIESNWSHIFHV